MYLRLYLWVVFVVCFLSCVVTVLRVCACCPSVYPTRMCCCVSMLCTPCLSLCVSVPILCKCLYCVLCVSCVGTSGRRWVRGAGFRGRLVLCSCAGGPRGERGRPSVYVCESLAAAPAPRLGGQSVRVLTSPQRVWASGRSAPRAQPTVSSGGAGRCFRVCPRRGRVAAGSASPCCPAACLRQARGAAGMRARGAGAGGARGRARAGGAAGPLRRGLQWRGRRGPR